MTEQELVTGLKNKNEKAFEALVTSWQNMVYNTALGLVQNEEDADDVAQEVFIKVFNNINSFKEQSSLKTWLYRITVNEGLGWLRQRKNVVQWQVSEVHEDTKTPKVFHHPGVAIEKKEDAALLMRAIQTLPANQKSAIVLQKLEGLNVQEVADVMELSYASVESLLSRAKTNLRNVLKTMLNR